MAKNSKPKTQSFSWSNLPDELVIQLGRKISGVSFSEIGKKGALKYLKNKITDDFLKDSKDILFDVWLKNDLIAAATIVDRYIRRNLGPSSSKHKDNLKFIKKTRFTKKARGVVGEVLRERGRRVTTEFAHDKKVPAYMELVTKDQKQDTRESYQYQKDAGIALEKHFINQSAQKGLLVLPTGAGKTYTSISWLN